MTTCLAPGWKAILSESSNPKRKYKYTLELIFNGQSWIGVNTVLANRLAKEVIQAGLIKEIPPWEISREVKWNHSRIDLMLQNQESKIFVEVKNVTLKVGAGAQFPDAVTQRGLKHLNTLMDIKSKGHRAIALFLVQREDVEHFAPASEIDPVYAKTLVQAQKHGVEILAYQFAYVPPQNPTQILLKKKLAIRL